jgi:hypothetical protein
LKLPHDTGATFFGKYANKRERHVDIGDVFTLVGCAFPVKPLNNNNSNQGVMMSQQSTISGQTIYAK